MTRSTIPRCLAGKRLARRNSRHRGRNYLALPGSGITGADARQSAGGQKAAWKRDTDTEFSSQAGDTREYGRATADRRKRWQARIIIARRAWKMRDSRDSSGVKASKAGGGEGNR